MLAARSCGAERALSIHARSIVSTGTEIAATSMMDAFLGHSAWRGYRRADFPARGEAASLISRERFGDFDLSLEWRLPVGGVLQRAH